MDELLGLQCRGRVVSVASTSFPSFGMLHWQSLGNSNFSQGPRSHARAQKRNSCVWHVGSEEERLIIVIYFIDHLAMIKVSVPLSSMLLLWHDLHIPSPRY